MQTILPVVIKFHCLSLSRMLKLTFLHRILLIYLVRIQNELLQLCRVSGTAGSRAAPPVDQLVSLFHPRWLPHVLHAVPQVARGTQRIPVHEFPTREPNGLLLYTDDGGTYDFFEVKLVEGNARLRFNLGGELPFCPLAKTYMIANGIHSK
ncbi:hypothetical protein CEXT_699081 [Caerostris extrusa]|uniref:Laminin G domain-containing protein n=1 Tax=Caerostris extrusa TaxID=172846 RepID=A0AAV4VWN4_CAEEX|nr:hypothetical protein CEXT_699081 [Caerostris extrusa]